jgi:cytochrome P450 family 6
MGRKMINFPKSKALKLILASTFQKQAMLLGIRWNDVDVTEFFINVVRETIDHRKVSGVRRNDFMQLLIDRMKGENNDDSEEGNNDEGLTFEEIAAQSFVVFFAGYDEMSANSFRLTKKLSLAPNTSKSFDKSVAENN